MEGKVLAGSWGEGEGPGPRPGRQVASGAPSLAGRLLRLLTEPLSPPQQFPQALWADSSVAVSGSPKCGSLSSLWTGAQSLLEVQTPSQELIGQAPR